MQIQFGRVKRHWPSYLVRLCVVSLWCGVTLALADSQISSPAQDTASSVVQHYALLDLNSPLPDPPLPLPIGESEHPMAGVFLNELMRREALLAERLMAVLAQTTDGSHQALRKLLGQMQALRSHAMAKVGAGLDDGQKRLQEALLQLELLDEERQADPYARLADHLERDPALLSVVSEVLDLGFSGDASCPYPLASDARWLSEKRLPLVMADVLGRLQKGADLSLQCLDVKNGEVWRWLQRGEQPPTRALREGYVAMVEPLSKRKPDSGWDRKIMNNLPEAGRLCSSPVPGWASEMCQDWIRWPQSVDMLALLPPGANEPAFDYLTYWPTAHSVARSPDRVNEQRKLLDGLVKGTGAGLQPWRDLVAQATQASWELSGLTIWAHPTRRDALVELHFYDARGNHEGFPRGKQDSKQIWRITPILATRLELPQRLYASGIKLSRVTDLHGDGLLQLWFAEHNSGCQQDESDAVDRDLHCRLVRADMLQLEGDSTLSHFRRGAPAPTGNGRGEPNAGLKHWMDASPQRTEIGTNLRLWGTLLAEPTGLNFGNGGVPHGRGDILSFASKPYPQNPDLTLVTLYHNWPQPDATAITRGQQRDVNNPDDVGFLVLLVDTARKKILRRYAGREIVDAGVRIWDDSLSLDTARYVLAPGVRAFGVRKGIGHSPCAADGFSNDFLNLFVEDGADAFRPVLEDLAMHRGHLLQGSLCGANNEPVIWEYVRLVLSVEPTRHEGWADLRVTANRSRDSGGSPDLLPVQRKGVVGMLRRQGGRYVCEGGCDP